MKRRSWLVLLDQKHEKKFFEFAGKVFTVFILLNPEFGDSGGCIVIRSKFEPIIIAKHIGKLQPINCRNDALELAKKLTFMPSIMSSTQINERPGAVVAEEVIISFAGLSDHGNEAIVLAIAVALDWITYEEATAVADMSNNAFFENLYLFFKKTPQAF